MNHLQQKHQCKQLISEIALLLDGELDRHSEIRILDEMNTCSSCKQYYNSHTAYKQHVSQKVTRVTFAEDQKESLRSKIRGL